MDPYCCVAKHHCYCTTTTPTEMIVMGAQCKAIVDLCYHYVRFSLVTCLNGNTSMLERSVICYPLDLVSSAREEIHHFLHEK